MVKNSGMVIEIKESDLRNKREERRAGDCFSRCAGSQ
jgi:hypothetical protein